jgi:rubrerythrin
VIKLDFNSVWSRVTGASGVFAEPAGLLRGFAEKEAYDAAYYSALAAAARSYAAKRLFCSLSSDENGHARRLGPVYFLLTGGCLSPAAPAVALPPSLLDAVRLRRGEELSAAEEYDRAADAWPDRDAARLFAELAAAERRHAAELRRLLEKCF